MNIIPADVMMPGNPLEYFGIDSFTSLIIVIIFEIAIIIAAALLFKRRRDKKREKETGEKIDETGSKNDK